MAAVQIDSGWAWMVSFGCFIALFMETGIVKGLGILLPDLCQEFGTQTWIIGFAISFVPGVGAITCPLAGILCKRYSPRTIVMLFGFLSALGLITASLAASLPVLLLSFLSTGFILGAGCIQFGQVAVYFHDKYDIAITFGYSGLGAGLLIIPPLTQLFIENYGWRGSTLLLGAIIFHTVLSGLFIKPVIKYESLTHATTTIAHSKEDHVKSKSKTSVIKFLVERAIYSLDLTLFQEANFVSMFSFAFGSYYSFTGWLIYLVPFAEDIGLQPFKATFLASYGGIASFCGYLLFPIMSRWLTSQVLIVYLSIMCALALFMYPLFSTISSYAGLIIASLLFAFARGASFLAMSQIVKESINEDQVTNAFSWIWVSCSLASMFGGFVSGWIYDQLGNFNVSFLVLGAIMLLSICPHGLLMIKRTRMTSGYSTMPLSDLSDRRK